MVFNRLVQAAKEAAQMAKDGVEAAVGSETMKKMEDAASAASDFAQKASEVVAEAAKETVETTQAAVSGAIKGIKEKNDKTDA